MKLVLNEVLELHQVPWVARMAQLSEQEMLVSLDTPGQISYKHNGHLFFGTLSFEGFSSNTCHGSVIS